MLINKPNRWENWNYNYNGFYFVTICTKDRYEYFGKIENKTMVLNNIGNIVKNNFYNNVYIKIYEYCIMPNHVHVLFEINNNMSNLISNAMNPVPNVINPVETRRGVSLQQNDMSLQQNDMSLQQNGMPLQQNGMPLQQNGIFLKQNNEYKNNILINNKMIFSKPIANSVPMIVNQLKGSTKRQINRIKPHYFKWQPNYYEEIIRDNKQYEKIKYYIKSNPEMWNRDRNNKR